MDLFAGGLGGFDVALRELGLDPLGIELDDAACATREACGLRTLQADVSALDPLDFAPVEGLAGSPPCTTFSSAGNGAGRSLEQIIRSALTDMGAVLDEADAPRVRDDIITAARAAAYAALEPTAGLAVLPAPRRARKRAQRAVSPVQRDRIARRMAKRATARREAKTSLLVAEPLRWALALSPRWIVLEQVPPVLPLWEAMCGVLRGRGYWTHCSILLAETFGVPQTRKRAFLIASLDGPVSAPVPTHQRYIAPRRREVGADCTLCRTGDFYGQDCPECHNTGQVPPSTLFAAPEPERIVAPEDRGLLPWRSMAEALGWGMTAAPTTTVVTPRGGGCETSALDGGSDARRRYSDAKAAGDWVHGRPAPTIVGTRRSDEGIIVGRQLPEGEGRNVGGHGWALKAGTNANDASRAADEPAPTLRFGARLNDVSWVSNTRENAATRSADEPAPTITGGHDHNERRWVLRTGMNSMSTSRDPQDMVPYERSIDAPAPTVDCKVGTAWKVAPEGEHAEPAMSWKTGAAAPTHYDRRQVGGDGTPVGPVSVDRPAPTIAAQGLAKGRDVWVTERPAITVNGDPRISEPGHHDSEVSGSQQANAVRVSLAEALVLQDFPPDTPVQGSKSKCYEQVGNACPPALALACLRTVVAARHESAA